MRRLASLASIVAVVLWACSSGAGDSAEDEYTLPSGTRQLGSGAPGNAAAVTVTGLLGFDDIEGGCGFLEAADGRRYEVIYPDGWTLDRAAGQLRGPDGQVAQAGESVTVRGSVATDRSSTCQVGPILVASDVEVPSP